MFWIYYTCVMTMHAQALKDVFVAWWRRTGNMEEWDGGRCEKWLQLVEIKSTLSKSLPNNCCQTDINNMLMVSLIICRTILKVSNIKSIFVHGNHLHRLQCKVQVWLKFKFVSACYSTLHHKNKTTDVFFRTGTIRQDAEWARTMEASQVESNC